MTCVPSPGNRAGRFRPVRQASAPDDGRSEVIDELLAERGGEVDHVTVYRWVQRFTPLFADAARPLRHATGTAGSSMRPTSRSPAEPDLRGQVAAVLEKPGASTR